MGPKKTASAASVQKIKIYRGVFFESEKGNRKPPDVCDNFAS